MLLADTRQEKGAEAPPSYEDLPPGLLEKLKALEGVDFLNSRSSEAFQEWHDREKDIQELLAFYSQWADRFIGSVFLGFEEALELMRRFKSL